MFNHKPPTQPTQAPNRRQPPRLIVHPEDTLWIFCWPESKDHKIVLARTEQFAVNKAPQNGLYAVRSIYRGGPCPVCNDPGVAQLAFT